MDFVSAYKNLGKVALTLTIISFLWISIFGLFHMSEMKSDGTMSNCLLNGQLEVCTMNLSAHIALWQNILTGQPQNSGLLGLLILITALAAIIAFGKDPFSELYECTVYHWRLYIKQYTQISLFNFLREAFSQGILNSKKYAAVA